MNRLRRVVLCVLLIAGSVATVSAEVRLQLPPALKDLLKPGIRLDAPVHMTADTLSYDEDTGVAVAEGNVEMAFGTRTMRADRIRYDSTTGEADLTGKVRYKDATEEFAFDRITINLDSETGVLYNGTIRISSSNYLIASQKFEKTGKSSFLVEKGSLTTCPCDPEPDWKFEVRRARVTLDRYAIGRDITFRIRGVPVLWLPWGAFPVKMTRQSGLLLPNFSSNRSRGYTLQVPYYQVINRWSDATVTLDAMSRRGYRPEAEYRFVLNPESEGAVRATMFHDRVEDRSRGRYYGENVFRSGPFTANATLEVPTDPTYYLDLVDNNALLSARHARSEGFVSATGAHSEHAVSILWNKDLQEIPGPDNTAQVVPEYTMTLLPSGVPFAGVDLSGEISATRFQRGAASTKSARGGSVRFHGRFRFTDPSPWCHTSSRTFSGPGSKRLRRRARPITDASCPEAGRRSRRMPARIFPGGLSSTRRGSRSGIVTFRRTSRSAPRHRPMVEAGAPEPVSLYAFTAPPRDEGGRGAEGVPFVPHRVGL